MILAPGPQELEVLGEGPFDRLLVILLNGQTAALLRPLIGEGSDQHVAPDRLHDELPVILHLFRFRQEMEGSPIVPEIEGFRGLEF